MGRKLVAVGDEVSSLIWPILAIISIALYSVFPQYLVAAKTNINTKNKISQNKLFDSCSFDYPQKSMVLVQQNYLLAQGGPGEAKVEQKKIVQHSQNVQPAPQRKMRVLATAYSSTVDQCDSSPFITANGTHVYDGTLAANFLKFGTKVRFPALYGDKIFTVEDRMRSNSKVDLWFPTRQEAKNFGARVVEMEIL